MAKKFFLLCSLIAGLLVIDSYRNVVETQATLPWGVSVTSLSGATGTATGTSFALISNPASVVSVVVDITGTVTSNTILLEGSLDNSTWYTLTSSTANTDHTFNTLTSVKFVRPRVSTHGGGGGTTDIYLIAKGSPASANSLFSGGTVTNDINLVDDKDVTFSGLTRLDTNGTNLEVRTFDDSTLAGLRSSNLGLIGSFFWSTSFRLWVGSTNPTISSGFGTSPSITNIQNTSTFRVNVGTGGVATSGVIGMPTASNGWNCMANNISTTSATVFLTKQTASTTTTVTIGNFNTSAAAAAWAASDIIVMSCFAY